MYSPIQWLNLVATSTLTLQQFKALAISSAENLSQECPSEEPCEKVATWLEWVSGNAHRKLLGLFDPDYPSLLQELSDPPRLLFCEGDLSLLSKPQLAIVGTRHPSMPAREDAYLFARALAESGWVITSGLAAGIDGAAHEGALDGGGETVAVLGCGIDRVYPRQHGQLLARIRSSGLVVSEYAPGTPPRPYQFPIRNRIVSGLSKGVLVVEASLDSGSLITARHALEQNRDVFAIPGSIHNPAARGCHRLLKDGAMLVETVDDVFDGLGFFTMNGHDAEPNRTERSPPGRPLNELMHCVDWHGSTLDEVLARSTLATPTVVSGLMSLCLSGHLKEGEGRYYRVC